MIEAGWWQDSGALVVTFGLTGWLLGLAAFPERLGLGTRAWLSLALCVPATVLIAAPGLVAGRLNTLTFLVALLPLIALAIWRSGAAIGARGLNRSAFGTALGSVDRRGLLVAPVVALTAWFAVLAPQVASRRNDGLPLGTTVWYYWWLVQEVATQGGLPDTITEWGTVRPFPVEYLVTTLHGATTSLLAGGTDYVFLERYRLVLAALALPALYALWCRWLPQWWAWIAALLTLGAGRISGKFVTYRPETFGLLLVIWSAWLLDEALRRRSIKWATTAGIVSASAFLAHAEIWLITAPLWLGILAGRAAPYLRDGVTLRRRRLGATDRRLVPDGALLTVRLVSVAVLVFGLGVILTSLASGGGGRLAELVGVGSREEPLDRQQAAAQGPYNDPTWRLFSAIYYPQLLNREPLDVCSGILSRSITREPYRGMDLSNPWIRTSVIALTLILLTVSGRPYQVGGLVTTWIVYALGIYVLTRGLCTAYDTFVPERAGPTRIMPYYVMGLAGLLSAFGWLLSKSIFAVLQRLSGGRRTRLRARVSAGLAVGIASAALLLNGTSIMAGPIAEDPAGLSPASLDAYRWMQGNLPQEAVVLANGYTEGSLGAVSGRVGWLDGRAPYLESSSWLQESTQRLLDSRDYFADPIGSSSKLPAEIDYVLVARRGASLGGFSNWNADIAAFRQASNLRLIRDFSDDQVLLFEVRR